MEIRNESDLDRIRRSKYVQSYMGNVYSKIKERLEQEIDVLFVGTPCQVAGLKKYLGRQYDRLLTVDLVCHGVPVRRCI